MKVKGHLIEWWSMHVGPSLASISYVLNLLWHWLARVIMVPMLHRREPSHCRLDHLIDLMNGGEKVVHSNPLHGLKIQCRPTSFHCLRSFLLIHLTISPTVRDYQCHSHLAFIKSLNKNYEILQHYFPNSVCGLHHAKQLWLSNSRH